MVVEMTLRYGRVCYLRVRDSGLRDNKAFHSGGRSRGIAYTVAVLTECGTFRVALL